MFMKQINEEKEELTNIDQHGPPIRKGDQNTYQVKHDTCDEGCEYHAGKLTDQRNFCFANPFANPPMCKIQQDRIARSSVTSIGLVQEYTDMIQNGEIDEVMDAVDRKLLTTEFKAQNTQSALSLAFYAKQYEVFVFLKSRGFKQFAYEAPIEIKLLPYEDQEAIKFAMHSLIK